MEQTHLSPDNKLEIHAFNRSLSKILLNFMLVESKDVKWLWKTKSYCHMLPNKMMDLEIEVLSLKHIEAFACHRLSVHYWTLINFE